MKLPDIVKAFILLGIGVAVCATCIAVANPEGWAAWRVALVAFPCGIVGGVVLGYFVETTK